MSRAISVKVATPKVIKALETKLATIKETYANQDKLEAEFQTALTAWNKSLSNYALSKIAEATNIRTNVRTWSNTMNIDFDVPISGTDFPPMPERKFEQLHQHTYRETVEEIENALSILRMTDEETVNASTMKQIARYL
jgi:hypothetical protein